MCLENYFSYDLAALSAFLFVTWLATCYYRSDGGTPTFACASMYLLRLPRGMHELDNLTTPTNWKVFTEGIRVLVIFRLTCY
jgi:hypothetical protein